MTSAGMTRSLIQGIVLKVGFPLLIALITLTAGDLGGMQARDALELAAIVAFAVALILFVVDTEIRFSAVAERVSDGFGQTGRLAELSAKMERSSLGQALLAEFLETASQVDGRVNPLLQRLARREVERVTSFARQLALGGEIAYDGEDREWLLGLAQQAQASIDAISSVHGGRRGARARRRALDERTWASVTSTTSGRRSPGRSASGASSCSRQRPWPRTRAASASPGCSATCAGFRSACSIRSSSPTSPAVHDLRLHHLRRGGQLRDHGGHAVHRGPAPGRGRAPGGPGWSRSRIGSVTSSCDSSSGCGTWPTQAIRSATSDGQMRRQRPRGRRLRERRTRSGSGRPAPAAAVASHRARPGRLLPRRRRCLARTG